MSDQLIEFGPIDVNAARRRTLACLRRVHLLSAGSSLPSTTTADAVVERLQPEAYESHAHSRTAPSIWTRSKSATRSAPCASP